MASTPEIYRYIDWQNRLLNLETSLMPFTEWEESAGDLQTR